MGILRFQMQLCDAGIDCALVFSFNNTDPNFLYFTGIGLEYSFLIIPKKGNSTIITSSLEQERARRFTKLHVSTFNKPAFRSVSEKLRKYKRIGINKSSVSVNEFAALKKALPGRKWVDIGKLLRQTRKMKDAEEQKKLAAACRITDEIFKKLTRSFNFRTEDDIVRFLKTEAWERGCEMSFEPIVASGKSSSMPHYRGLPVALKKGFCVIDFGVLYQGYHSDITRTIYLGKASSEERRIYDLLLQVQESAIKAAKPGATASDLSGLVKKKLGRYAPRLIHGLGHGIGVEIHELPSLSSNSSDILEEGDVFTIEPGIYFPGKYGIRIEDDIMIKNNKTVVMTHADKRLIEVRA